MALSPEFLANVWKIYYYLALFATVFFVLKLILFTFVGGATEVIADFNTEFETDTAFDFFSLQSMLAFLMGFGWMGYAALKQLGLHQLPAFVCAFITGLIFMLGTAFLMFSVKKLEKNVKKDKATTVGETGKAYTNFEPNGQGQIEIDLNGQLTVLDALNSGEEKIKAFDIIEVVKVENDIIYIRKKG